MKKLIAIVLSVILMLSVLPISVFATARDVEFTEHYIKDTFVYEFQRGEDKKFATFNVTIVHVYNDGSTWEESRTAYSNTGVETNYGTLWCTDTQDETPWVAGNTYQVESNFGTFSVEVKETPITAIEIDDINYCGINEEGKYYYYPTWMVYYTDGRCEEMNHCSGISVEGIGGEQLYCEIEYTDTQDVESWELGQTYEVTATLLGVSDTFNVTANTIADITIDNVIRYEGMGSKEGHWDDETDTYIENSWMRYSTYPDNITVILTDGSSISCSGYDTWCYSDESYDNQWGVGTHTATLEYMGFKKEYNIIIEPNPISSIEIEDVSIMEHSDGWDNGESFYYYVNNLKGTVTFSDGTVKDYSGGIWLEDEWYSIDVDTSIQYENPWTTGNSYEVTGTLMGACDTFNVTIVPCPVKSIDVEDISIIEGNNCHIENGNYFYNIYCHNTEAKITFTDGTVINDYYFNYGDDQYHIEIDTSSQYEEPWVAGNTYQVTATLLDASCTFNVTILPSPIKSIKFKDIVLRQGVDSYFEGEQDFYNILYEFDAIIVNDGETFEIDEYGDFIYNDEYYYPSFNASDMQWQEPWQVGGTYEVTGTLLGVSSTFNVTIVENPIESIELVKAPDKIEYLQGEDLNLKGLHIRINYKDGTYEDIIIKDNYTGHYPYERYFYSKKLDKGTSIYANFESSDIAIVYVFDGRFEIPITTKENLAEQITLKENADKSLTITVYNSDATSYDMKVLSLGYAWVADDGVNEVSFHTDKGEFNGRVFVENNTFAIELNMGDVDLKSNKIPKSEWFEVAYKYTNSYSMTYYFTLNEEMVECYDGTVTAKNIDTVIEMAYHLSDIPWNNDNIISYNGDYPIYSGDFIREVVMQNFALDSIDLCLSKYYDPQTDMYEFHDTIRGGGEVLKYGPDIINYSDGTWTVILGDYNYNTGKKAESTFKINDEQKIIGFSINKGNDDDTIGDCNGDGKINNKDLALLMQYINDWNVTINTAVADVNVDGKINNKDLALLMQYINDWNVTLGPKN